MLKKYFLMLCLGFYSVCTLAADAAALQGQWSGVWYIGMSSGKAHLHFNEGGSSHISFTNLDEFGEDEITLSKLTIDSGSVSFSVPSKYSAAFQIQLKIKPDGKTLDGGGKFDGAGAKLVFTKSN
jgi:hypothetical protein